MNRKLVLALTLATTIIGYSQIMSVHSDRNVTNIDLSTIDSITFGASPIDYTATQTFAERPEKGYENFRVFVDYSPTAINEMHLIYSDYGVIALPKNYDPKGKPVRLIVFCQGTGERTNATTNPLGNHGWAYYLAKGYAVMDMNGYSAAWAKQRSFPIQGQHYAHKSLLESYRKGYEYVMSRYNLKKEVFLAGLSMGGGASFLIANYRIFPVLAQVGFCPAISVFKNDYMKPWGGTNQQITIAGQWDFPNWKTTTPSANYFLQNLQLVKGYDNMFLGVEGDSLTIAQALRNYGNATERAAFQKLKKKHPCPVKIWHCLDDATVLPRYSEFMVNMIKKAGGQAELQTFPTGGHLGGWNNSQTTDTDYDGKTISVSTNFKESLKFLQQYE